MYDPELVILFHPKFSHLYLTIYLASSRKIVLNPQSLELCTVAHSCNGRKIHIELLLKKIILQQIHSNAFDSHRIQWTYPSVWHT